MSELTISIPAYNDAPSIRAVVEESVEAAGLCTASFEILVINDGSNDSTQEVVNALCRQYPCTRTIRHERNLGFGPTIREAYLNPESDWVVFLPGDGQIPPREIVPLWEARDGFDVVLAVRRDRRDPVNRRLTSWCYNRLVSLVAGKRIHDVNATALVRRALVDRLALASDSAFVHAELVLKLIASGAQMREVEIDHRAREFGSGSGNRPRVIWGAARDLARYALQRETPRAPAKEASA